MADPARPSRPALGAAIVVAGGGGRRLGGVDKPGLRRGGTSLLDVVLDAVRPDTDTDTDTDEITGGTDVGSPGACGRHPVVVVGPSRVVPRWVIAVREDPPGGGPAAAVAAGLVALRRDRPRATGSEHVGSGPVGSEQVGSGPAGAPVALLAADLPRVTAATVDRLVRALNEAPQAGAAVLVDDVGRRQLLLAVWRPDVLERTVGALPDRGHGRPLRSLYDGVAVVEVPGRDHEWVDVDTPDDRSRWWPQQAEPPDGPG